MKTKQPTFHDICRRETDRLCAHIIKQREEFWAAELPKLIRKTRKEIRDLQEHLKKYEAELKKIQDAQTPNLPNIP